MTAFKFHDFIRDITLVLSTDEKDRVIITKTERGITTIKKKKNWFMAMKEFARLTGQSTRTQNINWVDGRVR